MKDASDKTSQPTTDGATEASDRALEALQLAFDLAAGQISRETRLPVAADRSPDERAVDLELELGADGRPLEEVVRKLSELLAATPSSASPRFFNQLFGGRDPVATIAEMMTPLVNSSMYTYKVAGPQILVEREVLGRMARKIGYGNGEGAFCPGGSLSNLVAMLVARNEAVESIREDGLGGERLMIYTSTEGHYSIRKNAGILGLGRRNVRQIPADGEGRMRLDELQQALADDRARGNRPFFLNATAGTTVLGAFDPLIDLAAVAREQGLWLHVDGALGGSVALCKAHRHLLDGAELSDSFTWNAHKMLGVPLACSAVLLQRQGLLGKHLSERADYLFQSREQSLDPGTRSLQCGRRNDALKLWAAWQLHGDRGYDERIQRLFRLARYAARKIDQDPRLELLIEPPSINVCFVVRDSSSAAVCDYLERHGRLLIGHGKVGERSALRLVVVNPDLRHGQIDLALDEIKRAAAELADTASAQPS